MNGWGTFGADYKSLRDVLRKNPAIADVAMKQYDLPLRMGNGAGVRNLDDDGAIADFRFLNLSRDDHNPIFIWIVGSPQDAIQAMEKMWKGINPNVPFEYTFLMKPMMRNAKRK